MILMPWRPRIDPRLLADTERIEALAEELQRKAAELAEMTRRVREELTADSEPGPDPRA